MRFPPSTSRPENRDPGLPRRRRVLIVEDSWFFAACLRVLIDGEDDLAVCDSMVDDARLLERIRILEPDILVLDLTLQGTSGVDIAMRIRAAGVLTPILFLSSHPSPPQAILDTVGRARFASKAGDPKLVLPAIRMAIDAFPAPLVEKS